MRYIGNAFSLQMVRPEHLRSVRLEPCRRPDSGVSIVGHADTAKFLNVEFNRQSVVLNPDDELFVAQIMGGRLPEGSTTLPDGVHLQWIRVFMI